MTSWNTLGRVPATLYLPGDRLSTSPYIVPPVTEKIPGVVLIHGYSGDRIMMTELARTLAMAGYAVVTIEELYRQSSYTL